jgi:hypothetical protein
MLSPLRIDRKKKLPEGARKAFFLWGQQINSHIFNGNHKESRNSGSAGDTYVEITQLVKQRMIQMGIVPGYASSTSYINVCRFPANEKCLRSKVSSIQ